MTMMGKRYGQIEYFGVGFWVVPAHLFASEKHCVAVTLNATILEIQRLHHPQLQTIAEMNAAFNDTGKRAGTV